MKDLFLMGGPIYMSILSLLFAILIGWFVYHFSVFMSHPQDSGKALLKLSYGKALGLFSMITGIFGQLTGFYQAFSAIEQVGDISPTLVYGAIKVSMITTLYGILIYLISILLWFLLSIYVENKKY